MRPRPSRLSDGLGGVHHHWKGGQPMGTACFVVDDVNAAVDAGVGAMFSRSHERQPFDAQPRPMPHLAVITAAGIVCLDCPATDPPHAYWSRTGEPPNVTVKPSLDISSEPAWHGFLTDGVLVP